MLQARRNNNRSGLELELWAANGTITDCETYTYGETEGEGSESDHQNYNPCERSLFLPVTLRFGSQTL